MTGKSELTEEQLLKMSGMLPPVTVLTDCAITLLPTTWGEIKDTQKFD
ncbi:MULTISPECIES: hypothetical protein [unclassified Endozoicomonas]